MADRQSYLDDEFLLVRDSGELPEVVFHSALYYLCHDPEGPGLDLTDEELQGLQREVVARYGRIIRRDLNPRNRDRPIYRGLARAIANWQRLGAFCGRQGLQVEEDVRREIATALCDFLRREHADVSCGSRTSSINCTVEQLREFAAALKLGDEDLPPGLQCLFS